MRLWRGVTTPPDGGEIAGREIYPNIASQLLARRAIPIRAAFSGSFRQAENAKSRPVVHSWKAVFPSTSSASRTAPGARNPETSRSSRRMLRYVFALSWIRKCTRPNRRRSLGSNRLLRPVCSSHPCLSTSGTSARAPEGHAAAHTHQTGRCSSRQPIRSKQYPSRSAAGKARRRSSRHGPRPHRPGGATACAPRERRDGPRRRIPLAARGRAEATGLPSGSHG